MRRSLTQSNDPQILIVFFTVSCCLLLPAHARYGHYGGHHGGHFGEGIGFHYGGGHGGHRSKGHYSLGGYGYRPYYRNYSYGYSPSYKHRYSPSYGRSYGYSPRSYSSVPHAPKRTQIQRPTYAESRPGGADYETVPTGAAVVDSQSGESWSFLTEGRPLAALRAFGTQAQTDPNKGAPKVGYALASAAMGELEQGIWAMRRAFKYDPEGVHYVTLSEDMEPAVRDLIAEYEHLESSSAKDPGPPFMLAALHFLRRDLGSAQTSIDRAYSYGESEVSGSNLKLMIENESSPAPRGAEVESLEKEAGSGSSKASEESLISQHYVKEPTAESGSAQEVEDIPASNEPHPGESEAGSGSARPPSGAGSGSARGKY